MNRRSFLELAMAGIAGLVAGPVLSHSQLEKIKAPGDRIDLDNLVNQAVTVRIIHLIDSIAVQESQISVGPSGRLGHYVATPGDRQMPFGHHEFVMILGDSQTELGGFEVRRYGFGL